MEKGTLFIITKNKYNGWICVIEGLKIKQKKIEKNLIRTLTHMLQARTHRIQKKTLKRNKLH